MTDLTEFLLARIAEDEAAARAVKPLDVIYPMGGSAHPQRFTHARLSYAAEDGYPRSLDDREASAHYTRWDPARALADCEAKRRIVELHAPDPSEWWERNAQGEKHYTTPCCNVCVDTSPDYREEWVCQVWPCATARALVLPYADHPDYDESWRS